MKVLFIGNSHTYMNDMPHLFETIFEASFGEKTEVVMLAYSGRDWEWHRKEYLSVRYQLLYGHFDYCVLQQAAHPFPPEETTMENGRALIDLCRACAVVPVLSMTWAEKDFPGNQKKMIRTYQKLSEETGTLLCPVGVFWQKIRESHPEIELYYKDGEHASPYGDLLIALSLCRTLHKDGEILLPKKIIDYQVDFETEFPMALLDETRYIDYDMEIGRIFLDVIENNG